MSALLLCPYEKKRKVQGFSKYKNAILHMPYSHISLRLPREMLWGGRWEGGAWLGTHVRIKDFKI